MRLKQNNVVALFIVAIVLVILGCIAVLALNGVGTTLDHGVEVEDCDTEDRINREKECGFVQPAKTTKPAPAKSPVKPAPRTTR